ncbi:MAG: prepilin-type N-terminal cleavage/methylation domain-containing protein [Phycisphaerales bacterium]|nr:prepilin-type N-terminal cleavage/methylation domain-containing protein [Phycisphaerales bacterium]MCB9854562.1 prepilin-type N-terminal cleavage/methylation domain-containing protein [Phycisphaerales bacterium]MCB9863217.1 prepilin-type N-terminal cleavage/methylation domain-containing protein [Phycisphaerales bacterium]
MPTHRRRHLGFTLLELLVVIAVIALILAILLPALSAGRETANDLKCKTRFRAVTTEFILFADADGMGRRSGVSQLGENRFLIEEFQESVYHIDEYWDAPTTNRMPLDASEQPLMCPSGPSVLERSANLPCSAGAIGPKANVSVAFNKRLEKRTFYHNGNPFPAAAVLTPSILQQPNVPLLIDVDGRSAVENNKLPYYTAPPILDDKDVDIYESGSFWFPSKRHRGKLNVGFIGGHVLSSSDPATEPWWRWSYQPEP